MRPCLFNRPYEQKNENMSLFKKHQAAGFIPFSHSWVVYATLQYPSEMWMQIKSHNDKNNKSQTLPAGVGRFNL